MKDMGNMTKYKYNECIIAYEIPNMYNATKYIKHFKHICYGRCSCGQCVPMPSAKECICCTEVKAIPDLMENDGVQCITDHQGFDPVCLNTYVLDTAYNQYKQQYNNEILNAPE